MGGTVEQLRQSARVFREESSIHPQNAKLFSDEVLFEVLAIDASPHAKKTALAELAIRQMLSPRRYEDEVCRKRLDVTATLGQRFGARAFLRFRDECERCACCADVVYAANRAFNCLRNGAAEPGELSILESMVRPWLEADGVIPVFNRDNAYLLPFSFVERVGDDVPRVLDAANLEIGEWTEHFRKFAVAEKIGMNVRVAIQLSNRVSETGNSMMLPILMGWWRRIGELPRYNVLRFIATGAYEGLQLGIVDTAAKERLVETSLDGGVLIRPGAGGRHCELPVGIGRDDLLQRLRALAEESYDCSVKYAADRIAAYDKMVRERHLGDWAPVNDRLEHLFANCTEKDPEECLWGLMLRSAALCHSGMTEKAHELNNRARRLAEQMPEHRPQLLRLQIEELVILQDEEDFERIYRLAHELGTEIENFADKEGASCRAVDLQMRYWGTMGQFWLNDAVSRNDAECAAKARNAFDRALKCACDLYGRSKRANGGRAESSAYGNCAQDANYLLQWAAFFDRDNVAEAARRAKGEVESLRADCSDEEMAEKNDAFRRRLIALARYRAVLDGDDEIPSTDEDDDVRKMAETGAGWVSATTCKYLGAVAAAQGDGAAAGKYFDLALSKMKVIRDDGRYYGLVMRVIHMTVFAEAYRSLRKFAGQCEVAQRCRADALAMFKAGDVDELHKRDWKEWLESEGDDKSFPGKNYWY